MQHSFDIRIAEKYGVNVAIFLNNLAFWVNKNIANKKHFHDGRYWTYNSQEALTSLFPYWTRQNIRTIIKSCIDQDLILTGNYNETSYDKTTWYTLTDLGVSLFLGWNQPIEKVIPTSPLVEINQPIPDIKPDIKPDKIKSSCSSDDEHDRFDEFWSIYPKKQKKKDAERHWKAQKLNKLADKIIQSVEDHLKNDTTWQNKQFIPNPAAYLNGARWDDEIVQVDQKNIEKHSYKKPESPLASVENQSNSYKTLEDRIKFDREQQSIGNEHQNSAMDKNATQSKFGGSHGCDSQRNQPRRNGVRKAQEFIVF